MRNLGTRGAHGLNKIQLAAAIGCQIFNKQNTLAFRNITFNPRITAKAFWLFADILHRKMGSLGKPRGKWDTSCLATRQGIK